MKKKITGYKLLKDLPRLKKGAILRQIDNDGWEAGDWIFNTKDVQETRWFSPIYEEEKIVTIRYKNGLFPVRLTSEGAYFDDTLIWLHELEYSIIPVIDSVGKRWKVSISTVNIGCKEGIPAHTIREIINICKSFS